MKSQVSVVLFFCIEYSKIAVENQKMFMLYLCTVGEYEKSSVYDLHRNILILPCKSYHYYTVCIAISFPVSISGCERQLEIYYPFIAIDVSLSSNTTDFNDFSEIDLQPVMRGIIRLRSAPSIPSVTV